MWPDHKARAAAIHMSPPRRSIAGLLVLVATLSGLVSAQEEHSAIPLPSYHYGQRIEVSCLNRSIDTGEHIELASHELQYIPFATCAETDSPLALSYGVDEELNCTIPFITDPLFHLLEFYIHNDAPLACRLPARPAPDVLPGSSTAASDAAVDKKYKQEYVPLVFALPGTLQLSHLHMSTRLNVLLHSVPKHHLRKHDSGVIDSGVAYATSPLSHVTGPAAETKKLVIGDELPLRLSVRWFPTPRLPRENGKVEWSGLGWGGGRWRFGFGVGVLIGGALVATWAFGWEVERRVKIIQKGLGGATPLAFGTSMTTTTAQGSPAGHGWGYTDMGKRD